MFFIAGLGNPGNEYSNNRHNAGFLFLDFFLNNNNFNEFKKKSNYLYSLNNLKKTNIVLFKSLTFMNLTGFAFAKAISYFKIETDKILVIYDDASLPFGTIRIRESGSDGGHNGLKNIQQQIGTKDYKRIRLGIGSPDHSSQMKDYVLNDFTKDELKLLNEKLFKITEEAAKLIINNNFKEAMNKYNGYHI